MGRRPTRAKQTAAGEPISAELQMAFGKNLKATRERAGLSQTEVAGAAGVSQPNIARIETGTQNITLETMKRLADAVGSEIGDLLGICGATRKSS